MHPSHSRLVLRSTASGLLSLVVVAAGLPASALAVGVRAKFRGSARFLLEKFRLWQLAAIMLAVSATAAAVSRDVRFYAADLVFGLGQPLQEIVHLDFQSSASATTVGFAASCRPIATKPSAESAGISSAAANSTRRNRW